MFRLTVRGAIWMALLSAVLFARWLEYRSDALARHRDAQAIQYLKLQLSEQPQPRVLPIHSPKPNGLRPVPGNWDYQFPPHFPIEIEPLP